MWPFKTTRQDKTKLHNTSIFLKFENAHLTLYARDNYVGVIIARSDF